MKLSKIKKNPDNPRVIRDGKFEQLKTSIQNFPKMMELRPIVVDETMTILGGNMRFEAIKALGMKEIPDEWVKRASELTEEEKREFTVKDNLGYGQWDFDILANRFDPAELESWGMDIPPPPGLDDLNLDDFFAPTESPEADSDKIVLEYTKADAEKVRAKLRDHGKTAEAAVWSLLGL